MQTMQNFFRSAFVAFAAMSTSAWAVDLKPEELRGAKEDNKPVSVLQQRFFSKGLRPEIGVFVGTMLNEVYTSTNTQGVKLGLSFTESWGVEAQYVMTSIKDSEDRRVLNQQKFLPREKPATGEDDKYLTPDPEINPIDQIIDVNVVWLPFYGKMNLLDRLLVYTDLYFTAGVSSVTSDQGVLPAILLGAGQKFYLLKAWSFRLDFRDRTYVEKRAGEEYRKHSYHVDFGVSYYFL